MPAVLAASSRPHSERHAAHLWPKESVDEPLRQSAELRMPGLHKMNNGI